VGLKTLHWSVGCARKEKSNDSKRDPIEPARRTRKENGRSGQAANLTANTHSMKVTNIPGQHDGPIVALRNFRQAVPDLRCEIEQLMVAGDRVIAHLRFRGHFIGASGQKQGGGQTVDFIATDILRVQDGRITDNWHIEDNLTFMQQLGIVQL